MGVQRCCAADSSMEAKLEEERGRQLEGVPNEERLKQDSKILYALSHPLRLKMALLLLNRDHCVCELVQLTRKKSNLVSHHLSVMRKSGVVEAYTKSPWKYYRLNESAVRVLKGIEKVLGRVAHEKDDGKRAEQNEAGGERENDGQIL